MCWDRWVCLTHIFCLVVSRPILSRLFSNSGKGAGVISSPAQGMRNNIFSFIFIRSQSLCGVAGRWEVVGELI